jgi:hypothetical protein
MLDAKSSKSGVRIADFGLPIHDSLFTIHDAGSPPSFLTNLPRRRLCEGGSLITRALGPRPLNLYTLRATRTFV